MCRSLFVFLFLTSIEALGQQDYFQTPARGFVSWLPAASWEHSLLTGNGTMGALVFGNPHDETIILSHGALYLPQKRSTKPFEQASQLELIRKLMLEGKFDEATKIPVKLREEQGYDDARDPFIPAFDFKIRQQTGNITRYQRSVNYETGETQVAWQDNNGTYQRTLFVSRQDSVVVMRIRGSGKINGSLHFENRPVEWQQWQFVGAHVGEMTARADDHQWLTYRSNFKMKYPGSLEGYEGVGRLIVKGGKSIQTGNELIIQDADEVLVLIKIKPSYHYATSAVTLMKDELNTIAADYNQLLQKHVGIHGKLFNRSKLMLNAEETDRSLYAEEVVLKSQQQLPLAMIEKAYDAGRYNILCSTGTNPPNLQGLWSGTWTAPWAAGFTHDGNLPTAISIAMPGNMPELMEAYFDLHERLINDYRISAKTLYNCRGIHIPAQSTTSGFETDFGERWCLTFWTGAAGWAAHYFYDYYQHTGDLQFLAKRAYPFMKEAALFYEDFLTKGADGKLVFNPSYSPENNPGNNESQAVLNATMDVMIAKQLLRNCIAAAQALKVDADKIKVWTSMLNQMPAYEISAEGTLREWLMPGVTENYKHRHASHLYALYDVIDPDFKNNESLRKAASRAVDERMKFRIAEGGGEMAFGLVQLALTAAHLKEGEKAHQIVEWLAGKYWTNGFGSYHNVGGLFNTDISGGLPYVITQMLVYSEKGKVSLLPALPAAWKSGSVEGLLLRGQLEVKKLSWNEEEVIVELISTINQPVVFDLPFKLTAVTSNLGKIKFKQGSQQFSLDLPADKILKLTIKR